jgi:hypothetical protein
MALGEGPEFKPQYRKEKINCCIALVFCDIVTHLLVY